PAHRRLPTPRGCALPGEEHRRELRREELRVAHPPVIDRDGRLQLRDAADRLDLLDHPGDLGRGTRADLREDSRDHQSAASSIRIGADVRPRRRVVRRPAPVDGSRPARNCAIGATTSVLMKASVIPRNFRRRWLGAAYATWVPKRSDFAVTTSMWPSPFVIT